MKWETKEVDEYSKWDKANIGKFNEERQPLIPMDPKTGKKLQFVGSGTFGNGKMNGTAAAPAEKATNGTVAPPNNDGIPIEAVNRTIKKRLRRKRNKWTLIITFSSLVLIIIFITIAYLVARQSVGIRKHVKTMCNDSMSCSMFLTETIPSVLQYKEPFPKHDSISTHWIKLIQNSKTSIDIISFYWTLKSSDVKGGPFKQAAIGEKIFGDLKDAAARGVKIRIVQNSNDNANTKELAKMKNVEVRTLIMKHLLKAGIVHTKFFAVDGTSAYVGSANMDWRALTEVKELGVVMYDCHCSVADASKIFESNWMLAADKAEIPRPHKWPQQYHTQYNKDNPIVVQRKESPDMKLYWALSPPPFCPPRRTSDKEAILDIIGNAKEYIYIAVMDYLAAIIYSKPERYWDAIDSALRTAAFDRGVKVRLMTSKWKHTRNQEIAFLKSLKEFGEMPGINGSIKVKMFKMPSLSTIPYSRVSHSKFMVTDNAAFVSTSNWSGDYFEYTGGISLIMNDILPGNSSNSNKYSMHDQLQQVFLRDWTSKYAGDIQ